MGKSSKSAPWLNLAAGLLFLFAPVRDRWMPGFMSLIGTRHSGDIWLNLTCAALFLFTACMGFMRMRRPADL